MLLKQKGGWEILGVEKHKSLRVLAASPHISVEEQKSFPCFFLPRSVCESCLASVCLTHAAEDWSFGRSFVSVKNVHLEIKWKDENILHAFICSFEKPLLEHVLQLPPRPQWPPPHLTYPSAGGNNCMKLAKVLLKLQGFTKIKALQYLEAQEKTSRSHHVEFHTFTCTINNGNFFAFFRFKTLHHQERISKRSL